MPFFGPKEKTADLSISTVIGEHTRLLGNLEGKGSLRIDGEVEGEIKIEASLIIGPKGRVRGGVNANIITVAGRVDGDIFAKDRVELLSSAQVKGNITSTRIEMKEGAILQGKVEIIQNAIQEP
ncbi:MAG: hypothetical protein DDT40_00273 [candidate division WS2 bacterium]|uniref:Polymer-forming cytoskeletal protein n=1 Tax=Psychracetigena formicireducens TaxID=2986056 RepID=A0A9E2BK53_PSYF1|nr:hypothetical protein [Candidatus Psychracetigena formicireducens]MBT9144579.1 hypothetical protein [Candidatus Psychracetigena formicireducens]MBT9150107.1 hypothetical protein [Candidatus Psychracetigena formicireducens]